MRFKVSGESDMSKVLNDLDALLRKQEALGDENSRVVKSMNSNIENHSKQYNLLGNSIGGVKNLLLTAFGISQIQEAILNIFNLTSTYEKYDAALTTGLGSQKKAGEALEMLQNYADKTNFTLDELAETFTKLANRGLVVSREEMVKLGDVANTLQKPFGDLVEAILDVNNTERWNELGIKAQTNGDKVALTFRGVTLEVERSEKGVLGAVAAFGTLNGVQGATAAQAQTLAGKLSTLQDSAAGLGRTVGNAMTPAFEAAIESSGGLITVIAGSNSAFDRTVDYVKSAAAALTTFQIVTNATEIKTIALSAAMAAKEVVMKSYQIVVGTSQIAMQALSSAMGANITITTAATTAARSFWAALAANPIGLIVTAVGVATSAYYAWKAAHAEVNVEIDAATEKIMKERVELQSAVLAVQGYSMGTRERTEAVEQLMSKYPGLLGYIDADRVSNLELNTALAQQIALLDSKIKYAAAAAQADAIYNQQVEINKQQFEIIIKLRGAYKELSEAYPDNDKFVAALKRKQEAEYSNAESMRNMTTAAMAASGSIVAFSGETAKYAELQKESAALSKEMSIATIEVSKASSASTNAQVADIQRQLVELTVAHNAKKVNDAEYKAKRQELFNEIKRLNDEEIAGEVSKTAKLAKEGKEREEQAFLSAKEIAVLTKEIQEDSLKDQLALVDAKMKLEIEQINTHKVATIKKEEDAVSAIKAIVEKAEKEKEEIVNANRVKITTGQIEHVAKTVELETKLTLDVQATEAQRLLNTQLSESEKQQAALDRLEAIKKINEEEQKVIKETEDIEKESHNQRLKTIIGFLGSMSPELERFSSFAISVVDNIDLITGKSEIFYKKQAQDAENAMNTSRIFFGETSEQYNDAKLKSAEANKDLAEAQAKSSEASLSMAMALADLIKQVMGMVSQTVATSMEGILDGLNATSEAYQKFTDMAIGMNRQMIEQTLADTTMSFEEQRQLIDEFIQYEKDTLYGNERIQNEINTAKNSVELAKWSAERQGELIDNLTKGPQGIIANWKLVLTWREEQARREEELARQQTIFEEQQAIQRAQEQIATYKQMADERIRLAEETRDKEIEAQKQTNAVIENELDVLDTKRRQLLDDWLARRLKDLEDDKNFALAQAATEQEKANIIIKYQDLMQEAHDEYKEAELNKTKGVKIATEELKAQESDFIKRKEDETANTIRNINNQTTQMVREANREIFEANKAITIAELQGEIAKLKSKRWFMNANRVDSAIATIEGVISQIQGASFGGGNIGGGAPVEGDLGVNDSYVAAGQKAEDVANQAQRAMDATTNILQSALNTTDWLGKLASEAQNSLSVIEEAKNQATKAVELAEGTPYLEGIGFPNGIDTVPAMLTKGERVLPAGLNDMLGRVSNEKLVEGYLAIEEMRKSFGSLHIEEFGLLNFRLKDGYQGGFTDLQGLEKRVDKLIEVIRSKPELKINVDANRMSVAEISHSRQHVTYYENIYQR